MKELKFTLRLKLEHNPPTLDESMGQGVLVTQQVRFNTPPFSVADDFVDKANLAVAIDDFKKQLLDEYVEVLVEELP